MKDHKPTKKELASQARDLEEQVTRLKNRLNGQVFKKTKHGYRLDQLSEGARQLGQRVGELEQQLDGLGKAQVELTEKWQQLVRHSESEQKRQQETGGKKKLKEKLHKLKKSVTALSLAQKQIGKTLGQLQSDSGQVGEVRDDLKLESDRLRAQIRDLEESSSRLSVSQSAQEARTRELEGALAELTLKQEQFSKNGASESEPEAELQDEVDLPSLKQLQQELGEHTSEDNGRHKEVDRRLHELANRVGDLGGHFGYLKQDIAELREQREHLKQELDLRLRQLESRLTGIDDLQAQLNTLSDDEILPDLDQKISGVEAEVERLSESEDLLEERFQGLGGLELSLTSRLDDLQRELHEYIGRGSEFEETAQRLTKEFGNLSTDLQEEIFQLDQGLQGKLAALEEKLEQLDERALLLDNHRQEIDGQLDRIEESITSERERISQLEENFSRVSDDHAARLLELEQARELQLALQSRFEDLSGDFANQYEQGAILTARIDEHSGQMQGLSDRLDAQAEQQSAIAEANQSNGKSSQFALIALLLFGLLGGALIYFSSMGKIAESEQRIIQQLTGPDSLYMAREDASGEAGMTGSTTAGDNEIPTNPETETAIKGLSDRQKVLEEKLASFEMKLNLPTGSDQGEAQQSELAHIQGEIEQINSNLAQLGTRSASDAAETRLTAVESSLGESLDQLAGQISRLEARTAPDPERIAGIERKLNEERAELIGRINRLETRPVIDPERIAGIERKLNDEQEQLAQRISLLESRPLSDPERITGVERGLNETAEQLRAGLAQLDDHQEAIGKIERSLDGTGSALERRLDNLEQKSTGASQLLQQLKTQLDTLAAARESAARRAVSGGAGTSSPAAWQSAAEANRFAIQLAGARNASSLAAFAASRSIEDSVAYFRTTHEGRDWFILLYGPYASFNQASGVLESLDPSLNRYTPWIRRIPDGAELLIH